MGLAPLEKGASTWGIKGVEKIEGGIFMRTAKENYERAVSEAETMCREIEEKVDREAARQEEINLQLSGAVKRRKYRTADERAAAQLAAKELVLRKNSPTERRKREQAQRRSIWREAMAPVTEARQAELKLEMAMRKVLSQEDIDWIEHERFRRLCGSGVDESFSYLGFRAMLRYLQSMQDWTADELALVYANFVQNHLSDLSRNLSYYVPGSAVREREKALNKDVWQCREMFLGLGVESLPLKLAKALFSNDAERAVALG